MDERRTVKLGETYRSFAEVERKVIPIISKCLEGMVTAAKNVDERKVYSKYYYSYITLHLLQKLLIMLHYTATNSLSSISQQVVE